MPVKKRKLLNSEDKLRLKAQIARDKKEEQKAKLDGMLKKAEKRLGRKPFAVDDETRLWVTRYKGCGYSHLTIASAIGCDLNTLQKHFKVELEHGVARAKAEITSMIYQSAEEGNVGAQRKIYSILHGEADPTIDSSDDSGKKKLGKKELQQQEADAIEGKYEPPESPKPRPIIN